MTVTTRSTTIAISKNKKTMSIAITKEMGTATKSAYKAIIEK